MIYFPPSFLQTTSGKIKKKIKTLKKKENPQTMLGRFFGKNALLHMSDVCL